MKTDLIDKGYEALEKQIADDKAELHYRYCIFIIIILILTLGN